MGPRPTNGSRVRKIKNPRVLELSLNATIEEGEIRSPTLNANGIANSNDSFLNNLDQTINSRGAEESIMEISSDPLPETPSIKYGGYSSGIYRKIFATPIRKSRKRPKLLSKGIAMINKIVSRARTPKKTSCTPKLLKRLKDKVWTSKDKSVDLVNKPRFKLFGRRSEKKHKSKPLKGKPRPLIIDGSNIAMGYGKEVTGEAKFMCKGIELCVNHFKKELPFKGNSHTIIVFVPEFRSQPWKSIDTYILHKLERKGIVKYTPTGQVNGQRYACYDDNYIVEYAHKTGGIIVSNDKYRDLKQNMPQWSETIDKRRLGFTWVGKTLMIPQDPLGKFGPNLAEFILKLD